MSAIDENSLHSMYYVLLFQFFISHNKSSWSKFSETSETVPEYFGTFISSTFSFLEAILSLCFPFWELLGLFATTHKILHTLFMCVYFLLPCLPPNRI